MAERGRIQKRAKLCCETGTAQHSTHHTLAIAAVDNDASVLCCIGMQPVACTVYMEVHMEAATVFAALAHSAS